MCIADSNAVVPQDEQARLARIVEQTGSGALAQVVRGVDPMRGTPIENERDRTDWISTCLMDAWRQSGNREAMGLLFEINCAAFLRTIRRLLPAGLRSIDPEDVLQDVFASLCRYPRHFQADNPAAFRKWAYCILRNRLFRTMRESRRVVVLPADGDAMFDLADHHDAPPERAAIDRESAPVVDRAYLLLLGVFQSCFEGLPERDQELLRRVELDSCSYRLLAEQMGVSVGVIKVRVFRCRKRIEARIDQVLCALGAGVGGLAPAAARRRRTTPAGAA